MGILSLSPNFVWVQADRRDLALACLAEGWTLGYGFLVAVNCWKQTSRMKRPTRSLYAWLIWTELIFSEAQDALDISLNTGLVYPNFWVFLWLLLTWVPQTQCTLQIICNRIALVDFDRRRVKWIKTGTAVIFGLVNISVFVIWMPARMQISERWIELNDVWDRAEKGIYLALDLCLNLYFIITVKRKLVLNGMTKFDRLVRYNQKLILISISMDAVLLASMSFTSGLVYGQFHPVTYLIKLNIELALADMIVTIAKEPRMNITFSDAEGDKRLASRKDSYSSERGVVLQEVEDNNRPSTYGKAAVTVSGAELGDKRGFGKISATGSRIDNWDDHQLGVGESIVPYSTRESIEFKQFS